MTKTYFINYNPKRVMTKPKKHSMEMSIHLKEINVPTGITINEFGNMVSAPNSHTWFGGTFTNNITNQNWTSTQVIGLDFDSAEYTISETIEKLKMNGVYPQLWYSSFSSTSEHPKYRIVLFLDQPITNVEHRDMVYRGLLNIVPHADKSCKNAARIFFGGKDAVILHTDPISTQSLIDNTGIAVITGDKGRSRYIPEGLNSNYYGENGEFLSINNRNYPFLPNTPPPTMSINGKLLPTIDWENAKERVRILKDFLDGEWLAHMQLFGLATNLIHIKGGQKLMNDTMIKYNQEGKTDYSENNFNIITYVKKVCYHAVPIYKFSEHKEDTDLHDLYSSVSEIRGKIEIVKPILHISLNDAVEIFKNKFNDAFQKENDTKVYLFKVPTAIGKTELLTNIKATLAFPTHALKNEVKERMKISNVVAPDSITFKDENLNTRLKYLYGSGMLQKATAMIYEIASGKKNNEYQRDDINTAINYIKELNASQETYDTVLTTHARALHLEHKHSTIIYDEDPLETLLPIQVAKISDLVKVQLIGGQLFKPLQEYVNQLMAAESGICLKTPIFNGDPEELVQLIAKIKPDSNIIGLLTSNYFVKDKRDQNTLHYIQKNTLPDNKKIIILSATAPIPIYQQLFKERLEIVELSDVEQMGEIVQITKQSCSRNSLGRYAESIANKLKNIPVITFMSYRDAFKNPIEEMYFGNCSGYDHLKGKDIAVVGTPHRNNVAYHLLAAALGNVPITNHKMVYQKIEYNGFKFRFNCFIDETLRNIQLSLIESDLIQAVGRARTLRTKAKVQLYSNFPLRISSTFIF
jgi:hypothetical protein